VTELLTADNGKPGQIDNQMTVVYGEDIYRHIWWSSAEWQKKPWR